MAKKLLIIDSDKSTKQLINEKLSSDWEIFTARTGKEGLDQTFSIRPDCIVLDIFLENDSPPMNGLELLNDLKERREIKDIPVIVYSEAVSDEDILHLVQISQARFHLNKKDRDLVKLVRIIEELTKVNQDS